MYALKLTKKQCKPIHCDFVSIQQIEMLTILGRKLFNSFKCRRCHLLLEQQKTNSVQCGLIT